MYTLRFICTSAIGLGIWNGFTALGTVYNSDGSAASVQGLHNAVQNGDTITVPAGTFTWATKVNITKAITLQGAGVGQTIIKDAVQGSSLLQVTLVAGNLTRLTGIEFQDGGRTGNYLAGILLFTGSNTDGSKLRMDHCKINDLNGMLVAETVIGVIDHVDFIRATVNRTGCNFVIHDTFWNGGTNGEASWVDATQFGTDRFLFIEDCTYTDTTGAPGQAGITDSYGGARFVVRHCQIHNGTVQTHGTESNGRARGTRSIEVYDNTFTGSNINRFVGTLRSGVALFHDNTITGYWTFGTLFATQAFRCQDVFSPWGGADGTSVWDTNTGPHFSGTVTAVGTRTVTVSGANWTTNQWKGYTIRRDTTSPSPWFAEILSNTGNTIKYQWGVFGSLTFNVGDTFKIYRVVQALDSPGRARGSLITGNPPVVPSGWNDQVTEPCYAWNNPADGGQQVGFDPGNISIRIGEHIFNNTPMPGYTPYVYPHPLVSNERIPTPTPSATVTPSPPATATPAPSPTSPPSPTPTATPITTPTPRNAPTNLVATAVSTSEIDITWSDNSANETRFSIELCKGGQCVGFAPLTDVPANTVSYQNTGLARNTTYKYRIKACNDAGCSGYSNIAQAHTPGH